MEHWRIVTDSSCDYLPEGPLPAPVAKVPFTITIGGRAYVDAPGIDVGAMLSDMEGCPEQSRTACPSPGAWYAEFEKAERVIAITISARLSGSYASAMAARALCLEQNPEKQIFVLDSRSAGSALALYVEKALALIGRGGDFDAVADQLQAYARQRHTIFALSSFGNLVKSGRIGKAAGFIAKKLGIWGIGDGGPEGEIRMRQKTRGAAQVLRSFLENMHADGFSGGEVVISHCQNPELAARLRDKILERWQTAKVRILSTGGLCSYYAERQGLILAY